MAVEYLTIKVDQTGARVVKREIGGIGSSAKRTSGAIRALNRILTLTFAQHVIVGLKNVADGYTGIQNRLRVVTGSTEAVARATDDLFEIAKRSRTGFEATGEIYGRIALNTKDLGISAGTTAQLVETLNKAVKVGGGNAQESKNALIQLGQAFASNRLSGDELRSVLEQLPRVTQILTDSLGVNRGELRAMAKEGKITAAVMAKAILEQSQSVEKDFGKTTKTIGEGIDRFKTGFFEVARSLEETTGVISGFSDALFYAAENMESLVSTATTWILLANPITFVPTAAAKAYSFLRDTLKDNVKVWEELRAVASGAVDLFDKEKMKETAQALTKMNVALVDQYRILTLLKDLGAFTRSIEELKKLNDQAKLLREAQAVFDEIARRAQDLAALSARADREKGDGGTVLDFSAQLNQLQKLREEFDPVLKATRELAEANDVLTLGVRKGIITEIEALDLLARKTAALWDQLHPLEEIKRAYEEETALLALDDKAREKAIALSEIEAELRKNNVQNIQEELKWFEAQYDLRQETIRQKEIDAKVQEEVNRLKQMEKELYEAALDPQKEYLLALDVITDAYHDGTYNLEQYMAAVDKLNEKLDKTAKKTGEEGPLAQLLSQSTTVATAMENVFVRAFNSIDRALSDFLFEGKGDFKDFVQSLLKDIGKLMIRMALLRLAQSAFGVPSTGDTSGFGGIAALLPGLAGAAMGTDFKVRGAGGTDSEIVAFRATPGEQVSVRQPHRVEGGGGMAQARPIKIVNVTDRSEIYSAIRGSEGEQTILNVVGENAGEIRRLLGIN